MLTPQETRESSACFAVWLTPARASYFISHKLDEVLEIADRITVIRRGKVVGSRVPAKTNESELAELMVGRAVSLRVDRGQSHPGDVVLEVSGLRATDDRRHEVCQGVDLTVRAGEIVGIAASAATGGRARRIHRRAAQPTAGRSALRVVTSRA